MNNSPQFQTAVDALVGRFYWSDKRSGQQFFYDSLTGHKNITVGHLLGVVHQVAPELSYEQRLAVIGNLKLDRQGEPIYLGTSAYAPNAPAVVEQEGLLVPNDWQKPEVVPAVYEEAMAGIEPFLNFLHHALGDPDKVLWVVRHLAFRFQQPLVKTAQAMYLYGPQGHGKGTLLDILKAVFGDTAVQDAADASELSGGSAVDLWKRTLLVLQDVEPKIGSSLANNIKSMTGTDSVVADKKYQDAQRHRTPASLIMFSNHPPSFLEADDRRFFVATWALPRDWDLPTRTKYFNELREWMEQKGGLAIIAGFLKGLDIANYAPGAPPPVTPEKAKAIAIRECSGVKEVLRDFLEEHPEQGVFFMEHFSSAFSVAGVSEKQARHILGELGLTPAKDGKGIQLNDKDEDLKRACGSKRIYPWIRDGWLLEAKQGVPAVLIGPDHRSMDFREEYTKAFFSRAKVSDRQIDKLRGQRHEEF